MRVEWILAAAMACLAMMVEAHAQAPVANAAATPTVVALWPDAVLANGPTRGAERVGQDGNGIGAVSNISRPRIEIWQPVRPNGTAVLIMGGGGYFRVQVGNESRPVAQWLAAIGVTPVILYYRLPVDGWKAEAPFQDAQRAMRVLRARAAEFGIDPAKIGVLGLSAGGNLAAIAETRYDAPFYAAVDASDAVSARPDFSALIYPVISLQAPYDTTRTRRELGTQKDAAEAYSAELHVGKNTPPTFIAHAADDPIADVGHSLLMFGALKKQSVPVELHVFEKGGHGWALGRPGTLAASWPRLFALWARSHGLMDSRAIVVPGTLAAPGSTSKAGRSEREADGVDVQD